MGEQKINSVEHQLAERLRLHVDRLASLIGPRHLGRPNSLDAAATYIEKEFTSIGNMVERQSYDVNGYEVANLVIEVRGTHRPHEIAILGAHYDTVPDTPGADDNASAVATLIEVARLLSVYETQRTLRFVAFTCEEPPHFYTDTMGSQVYARQCRMRDEQIIGMICLEMVGYYTAEANSQPMLSEIPSYFRWVFPRRGDFLASVGNLSSWRLSRAFRRGFKRATHFPLFSVVLPEKVQAIRLSDNSSFWDQGYSALMLTDTSFLRNPHYHSPTDTSDTLDYDRMARVVIGVAGGMAWLAKLQGIFGSTSDR